MYRNTRRRVTAGGLILVLCLGLVLGLNERSGNAATADMYGAPTSSAGRSSPPEWTAGGAGPAEEARCYARDSAPESGPSAPVYSGPVKDEFSIDPLRRILACQRLAENPSREAFESLVRLLHDQDSLVRAHAAVGIAAFRDPSAARALAGALSSGDWRVRRCAAEGLAAIGGETALKALSRRLDDPSPWVRRIAAGFIGRKPVRELRS